ncbi:MAG: DUF4149 domain-containing protein [Gemmatimonadaceae bacterium]
MSAPYYINVTIHVLAALIWLGGMSFLALVGAPVLRSVEPASLRRELFDQLGRRFRSVGWITLGVLIVTGIGNLYFRGLLHWSAVWANADFWRSGYGTALGFKLAAVTVMLIVEGYHDWVLGPRAGLAATGSAEAAALRARASIWARVAAICGIVIVIAAVRLARP